MDEWSDSIRQLPVPFDRTKLLIKKVELLWQKKKKKQYFFFFSFHAYLECKVHSPGASPKGIDAGKLPEENQSKKKDKNNMESV